MDETNACFNFDSIYAIGSFTIQPPRRGETGWGPIEGLAAFKKEITDLLKTVEIKDRNDNVVEVRFGKHGTAVEQLSRSRIQTVRLFETRPTLWITIFAMVVRQSKILLVIHRK